MISRDKELYERTIPLCYWDYMLKEAPSIQGYFEELHDLNRLKTGYEYAKVSFGKSVSRNCPLDGNFFPPQYRGSVLCYLT